MMDATSNTDDRGLVAQVATGSEEAFVQLYERYAEAVAAFVTLRGVSADELGEVTGAVWMACWTSAARFRGDSAVKTWLFAIAARQVASGRRRHAVRSARELLVDQVPDSPSADTSMEAVLASAEKDELVAAVKGLPPELYETAVLAWVEEMPYADIAEVQGVPVGTVKSRIFNARARLAHALGARSQDNT